MTASPNLVLLNGELVEFSDHLDTTAKAVDDVREIISDVRDILEIPKDIRKASKHLQKTADSGGAIAKVLAKVGVLKPIAKPFEKTMYEVSDTFKAIDKKAAELEIKFKPYIAKMKTAEKKLKKINKTLEKRADDTDDLADHVNEINARLNITKAVIDNPSVPLPDAIESRLTSIFGFVNSTAGVANSGLVPLNNTMEEIEDKVEDLRDVLSIPEFEGLIDFVNLLKSIQGSLAGLAAPLEAVYDAAGPVIDALGSIFGFILAPLEAVLDAVLEATGIEDLLDEAAAFILGLLPDISVLQNIADALQGALDVQFDTLFTLGISNPLDGLLAELDPSLFLAGPGLGLGDPTTGDDIILGQFGSLVGDTIAASEGDDVIIGSKYADVLSGGAGADVFIATSGNDTIHGGGGSERDIVVFSGHSDDYAIRAEIGDDGLGTGKWTVSDYTFGSTTPDGYNTLYGIEDIVFTDRTYAIGDIDNLVRTRSIDGSYGDAPAGTAPEDINYNPLTGFTSPHDGVYGYYISTTYSDVRDLGGVGESITNPDDKDDPTKFPDNPKTGELQYTSSGIDLILTGYGYERIFAGAGNDQFVMTANGPVSVALGYPGDEYWGQGGNDLFLVGAGQGIYDIVSGGSGTDSVVYQAVDTPSPSGSSGISVFMENGGTYYSVFRPYEHDMDIDFYGRAQDDPFLPRLGVISGVENLNMTRFDDHVWGTMGSNILLGGGGDDQIRGLGGDDIIRGGDGDDTLIGDRGNDLLDGGQGSTEFVAGFGDDTMQGSDLPGAFNKVFYGRSENLTGSYYNTNFVGYTTTGYVGLDLPSAIAIHSSVERGKNWVSKYDANGTSLGQDQIYNIDLIVGTTGDDTITGAEGIFQTLHGLDGNDFIQAGAGSSIDAEDLDAVSTGSRLKGGFGNDTLMPSYGTDDIDGDEGDDTVIITKNQDVDGDHYDGDNSLNQRTEGTDTLDLTQTVYSW
ncbi:MAG: calcium-binding protein, partial [Paracoccaceae bacterium]